MVFFLLISTSLFSPSTLLSLAAVPVGRPISLRELYLKTVEGADSVRSKIEERVQADEVKNQGLGALLPTISGIATYTKADPPSYAGSSFVGSTQKIAKISGKEYLFKGTSEYAFLSQASRTAEAKRAEIENARLQYFVNLSSAYYDTLLKKALRNHAKTEFELYENQIHELRSRVKIGRSRASDLLSVDAARAGSEARLKAAESAVLESKLALSNLCQFSSEFDTVEEEFVKTPLASLDDYLHASIKHPDLVAARKHRDASEAGIALQRGFHFPTLDLSGNYYLGREGYTTDSKWDATLTLTVPIFSGGLTQSQVRQAASVYRENEVSTGLIERAMETEIRTLHQNLLASESELKSFSEAVELAKKSYEQIQRDYKFGLVTNLDLLNSLQTLTSAKRSYDQARYQHLLERARLEADAGRLPLLGVN